MKRLFMLVIYVLLILFASPSMAAAKTPDKGVERCFNYYNFGAVDINLSLSKSSVKQNEKIKLTGKIINKNTFPLVDVILYAQVRRLNEDTFIKNGHHLIDKLILEKDLNLLPGEEKMMEIPFILKSNYPSGEYELEYYALSKELFHYGGRPFLEQDVAGKSKFIISGSPPPDFYFDISKISVEGVNRNIRDSITEYPLEDLQFNVGVFDNRFNKSDLSVKIKLYSFEDTFEDKLSSQTEQVLRGGATNLPFVISPPVPGAYVVVLEVDKPVRSMLRYRFAVVGDYAPELRMNDVGVSDFPPTKTSRAWVCFHSPTPNRAARTTIQLSLYGGSNMLVDQVSLTDSFDGEVRAISLPLTNLANLNDFTVEAIFLQSDSVKSRPVRLNYSCEKFSNKTESIEIIYDDSSRHIKIAAKNKCGKNIEGGINLNAIRLKRNDLIIYEAFRQKSVDIIPLNDYGPGNYTVELKTEDGKIISKSFTMTGTNSANNTENPSLYTAKNKLYIIITIILLSVIILYTIHVKKNRH